MLDVILIYLFQQKGKIQKKNVPRLWSTFDQSESQFLCYKFWQILWLSRIII